MMVRLQWKELLRYDIDMRAPEKTWPVFQELWSLRCQKLACCLAEG